MATPIHPYDSGSTELAGAAALFSGKIYYFNMGGSRLYALSNPKPFEAANADNGWVNVPLPEEVLGIDPSTGAAPAVAVFGAYLYLFWVDDDTESVLCSRMMIDEGGNESWSPYVQCYTQKGEQLGDDTYAIAVTVVGNTILLAGATQVKTPDEVYHRPFYAFDPGNWNQFTKGQERGWAAFDQRIYNATRKEPGRFVDVAFSNSGLGQNYLIASYQENPNDNGPPFRSMLYQFRVSDSGMPTSGEPLQRWDFGDRDEGVRLARDPGGRIVACYTNYNDDEENGELRRKTYNSSPNAWSSETATDYLASRPPTIAYLFDVETNVSDTVTRRAVREWIFYSSAETDDWDEGKILCVSDSGGEVQRVADAERLNLTRAAKETQPPLPDHPDGIYYLKGFIDGPAPLPLANCFGQPDTAVSGNIIYGQGETQSSRHSVTQDWKVGVKASGKVELGVGVSFDISASAGTSSQFAEGENDSLTVAAVQNSNRVDDQFLRLGTAFLDEIAVNRTAYHYYPNGARDPMTGIEWADVRMELTSPTVHSYELYTVTPGDILSYTNDAWNQHMFPGYFDDVIIKNAVPLNSVDTDCLLYGWSTNGSTSSSYAATTTSFTETSWSLSTSVWGGVEFDFWGVSGSLTAGFDFNMQTVVDTEEDTSWGLNCNLQCPPPPATGGYTSYSFELVLTKPSKAFTAEFIERCPDRKLAAKIDPNGAAWKICARLTGFAPDGPVTALVEHGLEHAQIERLHARKIRRFADLCRAHKLSTRGSIDAAIARESVSDDDRKVLEAYRKWHQAKAYVFKRPRK